MTKGVFKDTPVTLADTISAYNEATERKNTAACGKAPTVGDETVARDSRLTDLVEAVTSYSDSAVSRGFSQKGGGWK